MADYAIGRLGNGWALTLPTPNAVNSAAVLAPAASLAVNEWVARPVAGADDWIELYNSSSTAPVALRNVYVGTSNALSQILSLSFVPARGFVQLMADENPGPDHLDLKLPAEGGAIVLYDTTGVELQRVAYGPQAEGVSRGRLPDGAANIVAFPGSASPGANNFILNYTGPVLNEVLARNASAVVGPFGGFSDFVELYNSASTAFDLSGMGLSDEPDGVKFVFPVGTIIPAGGHLVAWCDSSVGASTSGSLNTGFSLSSRSGGVYLFNPAGQAVNTIEYGFQVRDLPIGLSGGQWRLLSGPTPGAANAVPAAMGVTSNLRINEWMAEPAEGDGWLELYNAEPSPVSLAGLFLSDDPSLAGLSNSPIAALSFIGAKDWVPWIADGDPGSGRDHVRFQLDAAGETIRLYAPDFTVIDSVSFGEQLPGVSQGRLPDGASSVVSFPATPTPDASNYLPLPTVVISEILAHTDLPFEDAIEIQNVGASPVAIGGWWISNSQRDFRKFQVPPGTTLPAGGFKVFYENQFNAAGTGLGTNFTLNSARGDSVYLSEADAGGNLTGLRAVAEFGPSQNSVSVGRFLTSVGADFVALSSRTFGADNPPNVAAFRTGSGLPNNYPAIGPVIINEIMYHPVSGVGSNATEKAMEEFVELHNVTAAPVPLFDPVRHTNVWTLSGGVSFAFSSAVTIPARGYVTLVSFDPAVDTVAAANFRGRYGTNGTLVGPFSGRLNNTGEELALHRPDVPQAPPHPDAGLIPMILVDRVVYDDSAPWPAAADAGGASLQRTASNLYGNEPMNWKAEPATAGATNTPGATLAPTIFAQPLSHTAIAGDTVTLSVGAAGSTPLSYQWQRGGVDLMGATDPTLSIVNVQSGDAGIYSVIVTNSGGSVTSQGAILTVLVPPFIIEHPLAQSAVAGRTVQFVVSVGGTTPLSYQWRFNGAPIGDATDPALLLNNVQAASAGEYSVVITNTVGSVTSLVAALSIVVTPTITSDPVSLTVFDGAPATFEVSATGTAPLVYQWRRDGLNIPGATGAVYTINAANSADQGVYSVVVTNAGGSAVSVGAQLSVSSGFFLSHPKVAGGGFQFMLNGQTNRIYSVEVSSDFAVWTNLTNIVLNTSQRTISDVITNAPARFYRVLVQP